MGFGQLQTPQLVVAPVIPANMTLLPGTAASVSTPAPEVTLTPSQKMWVWFSVGILVAGGIYWVATEPKYTSNRRRRARRNSHRTDFDRLKDCQLEVQALREESKQHGARYQELEHTRRSPR